MKSHVIGEFRPSEMALDQAISSVFGSYDQYRTFGNSTCSTPTNGNIVLIFIEIRDWLQARGWEIANSTPTPYAFRKKGMEYLDSAVRDFHQDGSSDPPEYIALWSDAEPTTQIESMTGIWSPKPFEVVAVANQIDRHRSVERTLHRNFIRVWDIRKDEEL